MNLHADILTIVYHYCDDPTKFKLRLLSKETYRKIDYVFYDDKWFYMCLIGINNDTSKIKKVKSVGHLDQLKLFPYMTHLTFRVNFNQEIKPNVLPKSLTHLTFGHCFNQKIKANVLPPSLNHLTFDWYFNQEININVLPSSLTHLTFSKYYKYNDQIKENYPNVKIKFV